MEYANQSIFFMDWIRLILNKHFMMTSRPGLSYMLARKMVGFENIGRLYQIEVQMAWV